MVSSPSIPDVPAAYGLNATPMPVTFEPLRWPLLRLHRRPVELLGTLVNGLADERA